MRRIAKFMKVSKEQFAEGWQDTFGEISGEELERIYESVKLPSVQLQEVPDMISSAAYL